MRALQLLEDFPFECVGLLAADDLHLHKLLRVELAHGRMFRDRRRKQRLRVRGLVLLVMPVPAIADEIDHDVVSEAASVCEREPDRGERGLRIVGVHMNDRDVEPFGEVARIPRRASVGRVGGEADLVVRDQVQGATGGVTGQALEVKGLGDFALTRERRVAVDEDRQRHGRVVVTLPRRAVGLLGARSSLDNRIDRLEMARIRCERHRNLAGARCTRALRAEVVLHIAATALLADDDSLDRPLALELAQDHLVRASDDMGEHVEAAAVSHPDHDLVRTRVGAELDRLVEHRDHDVESFDRELLLPEEGAAQVALHTLDLAEPSEEAHLLFARERLPVAAGLDRLAQPYALLVVRDVLNLIGDRAAVDLAQARIHVGERVALDVEAEQRRRDARHQSGCQLRDQPFRLERRIAVRLGAERVEARTEVPVRAVRLDERHRRRDPADQLVVGDRGCCRYCRCFGCNRSHRRRLGCGRRLRDRCVTVAAVSLQALEEAGEPRLGREQLFRRALKERAPLGRDGAGVVEVLLEQQRRIARVQSIDLGPAHSTHCCSRECGTTRANAA